MRLVDLSVCACLCTRIGGDVHSNERLLVREIIHSLTRFVRMDQCA